MEWFKVKNQVAEVFKIRKHLIWNLDSCSTILKFKEIFLMFIYLFIYFGNRQWEPGRDREREGDTESKTGSRLWDVSPEPDAGPNPGSMRSWPEPKLDAKWLSHPGRPMI